MSLANKDDIEKLCQACETCKGLYYFAEIETVKQSYYVDADIENALLEEFDIESPGILKNKLQKQWNEQCVDYMQKFVVPITVLAFKNKGKIAEERAISPYIYEF